MYLLFVLVKLWRQLLNIALDWECEHDFGIPLGALELLVELCLDEIPHIIELVLALAKRILALWCVGHANVFNLALGPEEEK
jgi:hypothetical protein